MAALLLSACVAAWSLLVPAAAVADTFVTREGAARPTRIDALVLDDEGPGYALVERITLYNEASQLVWLRPLPSAPKIGSSPEVFARLAEASVRPPELAESLRRNPFGPSMLGLLVHRFRSPEAPSPPSPPPEARALQVDGLGVFQGQAVTSSVTGRVLLPEVLLAFLRRHDARLTASDESAAATYLNLGWSLLAVAFYDAAPSSELPARIGPVRFDFDEGDPSYPLLRRGPRDAEKLILYSLAPEPLVPGQLPLRSETDADEASAPPGTVVLTHADTLAHPPELVFALREEAGLSVEETDVLTQAFLRPGGEQLDRLDFVPPERALDAPRLPPPSRRGGPADIAFCLLLGLAPLVIAPESWLVWWLQRKVRESARGDASRFGVKLWSGWAILVAAFWFLTLEDLARVAAIGPLLIGLVQLATPYVEQSSPPVRVTFRKKRRPPPGGGDDPGSAAQRPRANPSTQPSSPRP